MGRAIYQETESMVKRTFYSRLICDFTVVRNNMGVGFCFAKRRAAQVAELADAQDLKSCGPIGPCGFDSRPGHNSMNL